MTTSVSRVAPYRVADVAGHPGGVNFCKAESIAQTFTRLIVLEADERCMRRSGAVDATLLADSVKDSQE